VFEPASVKESGEKGQSEGRDGAIDERKIRFRDTGIETEQGPQPEEEQHPAGTEPLKGMGGETRIPEVNGEPRQTDEEHNV
jgi:hypothetical protein